MGTQWSSKITPALLLLLVLPAATVLSADRSIDYGEPKEGSIAAKVQTSQRDSDVSLQFRPAGGYVIHVNYEIPIVMNCCKPEAGQEKAPGVRGQNTTYYLTVCAMHKKMVQAFFERTQRRVKKKIEYTYKTYAMLTGRKRVAFVLKGKTIGRTEIKATVTENRLLGAKKVLQFREVSFRYPVTVKRKRRFVDLAFELYISGLVMITSFGLGCLTHVDRAIKQTREPTSLLVIFCCQFIVLPPIAFGLGKCLLRGNNAGGLGLLLASCMPGGGLSFILVSLMEGDEGFNTVLNIVSTVSPILMVPVWLLTLGQLYPLPNPEQDSIPLLIVETCIVVPVICYLLGIAMQRFLPSVAEGILLWFVKPMLLLFLILIITLGIYINMYAFEMVGADELFASLLLPSFGLIVGLGVSKIAKLNLTMVRAIAIECATMNSLTTVVALRLSLRQPEADQASAVPLRVLFLNLVPFVLVKMILKGKEYVWRWCGWSKPETWKENLAEGIQETMKVTAVAMVTGEEHVPGHMGERGEEDHIERSAAMETTTEVLERESGQQSQEKASTHSSDKVTVL